MQHVLEEKTGKLDLVLDSRGRQINSTLLDRTRDIAQAYTDGEADIAKSMDTRLNQVGEVLSRQAHELTESLSDRVAEINVSLGSKVFEVAETLDTRSAQIEQVMSDRLIAISSAFTNESEKAREALASTLTSAAEALDGRTREFNKVLSSRSAELAGILDKQGNDVITALDDRTRAFNNLMGSRSSELTVILNEKGNAVIEALGSRGSAVVSQFTEVGEGIVQAITSKGAEIAEAVIRHSSDAARQLNESSDLVLTTMSRRSDEVVQAVSSTNEKLRTDVVEVIERMKSSNEMLEDILVVASKNLSAIEGDLSQQTGAFRDALDKAVSITGKSSEVLVTQVGELKSIAGTLFADMGRLSDRFEKQSGALIEASQLMDTANNRMEQTVEERKASMQELANDLENKTGNVEHMLRTFTTLMADSLNQAETRAREIGELLAQSTKGATEDIVSQLEELRLTASSEGRRAAEALRASHIDLSNEIDRSISEANERLEKVSLDMRSVTTDIKRDLDATRADLRRGIMDMPGEAQESAAAMRKAVTEQIDALKELGRIVQRHETSAGISALPRGSAKDNIDNNSRNMDRAENIERPARSGSRETATGRDQEYNPFVRKQTTDSPTEADNRSKGWMSDLLRRASQDNANDQQSRSRTSTVPTVESLDSLSADIVRGVDNRAFTSLWDRYRQGETNVFTRRLYTLKGQQTFDDLQSRYQRDPDFRDSIDRYVGDFEEMVQSIARDDHDGRKMDTYLASDNGKVYTMLAHASGRFR